MGSIPFQTLAHSPRHYLPKLLCPHLYLSTLQSFYCQPKLWEATNKSGDYKRILIRACLLGGPEYNALPSPPVKRCVFLFNWKRPPFHQRRTSRAAGRRLWAPGKKGGFLSAPVQSESALQLCERAGHVLRSTNACEASPWGCHVVLGHGLPFVVGFVVVVVVTLQLKPVLEKCKGKFVVD